MMDPNWSPIPFSETDPDFRVLKPSGDVGFDSIPHQLSNRAAAKGFLFNVLCVGETGIGKKTLMNSLFNATLDTSCSPSPHSLPSVQLKSNVYELEESNINLKLNIVTTLGFGDQINQVDEENEIISYIDAQFNSYLEEELKLNRCLDLYQDTRIHVCLYFISPNGLKPLDLVCMKKLYSKVNIIPLIAKADSMTKSELNMLKQSIIEELNFNFIKIYQFPIDDESFALTNSKMNALLPFAVVGSNELFKVGKKQVRGRQFPWGIVEIENKEHCDFVALRETLIATNMEDLKEQTHWKHYEMYRKAKLVEMGYTDGEYETHDSKIRNLRQELMKEEQQLKQKFLRLHQQKELEWAEKERQVKARKEEQDDNYDHEMQIIETEQVKLANKIGEFQQIKKNFMSSVSSNAASNSTSSLRSYLGTLGRKKDK